MGLFDSIRNAIFGRSASASATATRPTVPGGGPSAAAPTTSSPQLSTPPPQQPVVDVEAVLSGLAAKSPEKLNWQSSIVDLMKLVGLDSSLQNRKELARELGYGGDSSDSAAMNMWLHKQVMIKLAESGGKVPAALRGA